MSDITAVKCDGCGAVAVDVHAEKGWIRFSGSSTGSGVNITRTAGRGENKQSMEDYISHARDYCGMACLVKQLDKEAAKRKARKKREEKPA